MTLVSGAVWFRNHAKTQYARRYVVALYGISSGMKLAAKVSDGTYKEWREGTVSDAPTYFSEIDSQAVTDLKAVQAEIDEVMAKMGTPPGECEQADRTMQTLYGMYRKVNSTILTSPDPVSWHKAELAAEREGFTREIRTLKENIPGPIAEEIRKSGWVID